MFVYEQFHDGAFNGILVDGTTVSLFISTDCNERFVVVALGADKLFATDVELGNIIFHVATKTQEEITLDDIVWINQSSSPDEGSAIISLESARKANLSLLEIDATVGATCMVLCQTVEIITPQEWVKRGMLREE